MQIQTIQDKLLFNTFLLETNNTFATGFAFATDKKTIIIISNRHFAEQTDEIDFSKKEIKQFVKLPIHLNNGETILIKEYVTWYLHPSEDLAFFDLSSLLKKRNISNAAITVINKENIPSNEELENLDIVNDVIMVGYPNTLHDIFTYFPLFRVGKTAYHPFLDFNGEKHGIVDMACVPGSSGSPIFIFYDGMYPDKKNNSTVIGSKYVFLGIEFSMPVRQNREVYLQNDDNETFEKTKYVVREDINYGNYIKSSQISLFEQTFKELNI